MDLKWVLVRRIALVASACLLAGSAIAVYQSVEDAKRRNEQLVNLASRQLDLQLSRIARSTDIPKRFPDWDLVTSFSLQPGQCIEFRGPDGSLKRSSCSGIDAASISTPRWFLELYRSLIDGGLSVVKPIYYRGALQGAVAATADPVAASAEAWAVVGPLLKFSAAIVAALCVVAYFVIGRALYPAREVLRGLNRLARGDLACRLPRFRLAELDRISEVFNALAQDLSIATHQRAELARRLVDAQEQERRHIARELHDEIAQKLSALSAHGACVRAVAQREAPGLAEEVRQIETMASELMKSLRRTLTHLRPQEIDDLGLTQSLKALVAQHNETANGRTSYSIEMAGDIGQLRAETSAHVYRIVQEALTNASKHSDARHVKVLLSQLSDGGHERITLTVVDDGAPGGAPSSQSGGSGMIGMRERVHALSGKFVAGPLPSGGFGLQVEFPTQERGA